MSKQLLMYDKITPLNKEAHKALSLKAGKNFNFAKEVNSIPLTAVEFPMASAEYTIVFAGDETSVMPVVIVGVNEKDNAYITDDHQWKAKYIPAFVRRYPFVFSTNNADDRLTLCIDEAFEGFNEDGRGERLFDNDGEKTQYLDSILTFLEEYQAHFQRTQQFCQKLVDLQLLKPMSAKVNIADQNTRSLTGFMGVDRDKLKTLDNDVLGDLVKNDWMELIHLHLHSIRNFGLSLERVMESPQAVAEQPETEMVE